MVAANGELGILIYCRVEVEFQATSSIIATGHTRFAPQARWARRHAGARARDSFVWDMLLLAVAALGALDQAYAVRGAWTERSGSWRQRAASDRAFFLFEVFGTFLQARAAGESETPFRLTEHPGTLCVCHGAHFHTVSFWPTADVRLGHMVDLSSPHGAGASAAPHVHGPSQCLPRHLIFSPQEKYNDMRAHECDSMSGFRRSGPQIVDDVSGTLVGRLLMPLKVTAPPPAPPSPRRWRGRAASAH